MQNRTLGTNGWINAGNKVQMKIHRRNLNRHIGKDGRGYERVHEEQGYGE